MRWITGLCVALGLAALGAITPASATQTTSFGDKDQVSITAFSDCPDGWFCVWEHAGGQGRMARFQIGSGDLGAMDNQISSLWNRTGVTWCAYDEPNFAGPVLRIGNTQLRDLRTIGWDNRISALRRGCP